MLEELLIFLKLQKINKVKKIIHISTSEVYGTAQSIPINETHPVVGQSPYSASKIASEQLCIAYYKSFNLPIHNFNRLMY